MAKKFKFILTLHDEIEVDSAEEIEGHISWPNWSQADPVRYKGIFDSYDEAMEYASKFEIYKYVLNYDCYDSYEDEEWPRYFISIFDAEDEAYRDLGLDPGDWICPSEYLIEETGSGDTQKYKYCFFYNGVCVYESSEDDEYFDTYDEAMETAEDSIETFNVKDVFELVSVEILNIEVVEIPAE